MTIDQGSSAKTFVLVHGGGHGGWCWQRMAAVLRDHGHSVWTPTLTGFGERHHLDHGQVTFDTMVTDVAAVLEFEDLHDVVLVGHSMGGVIVPRVAEVSIERVSQVVFMAAVVLNDGESLLDAVPQTPAVARAVTIGEDGTAMTDHALLDRGTAARGERRRSGLGAGAASFLPAGCPRRTGAVVEVPRAGAPHGLCGGHRRSHGASDPGPRLCLIVFQASRSQR